jgi:predicted nucleic acid-binding protein
MKTWLIDTGPLVAYLNAKDEAHTEVATVLDSFAGDLASTSAIITETMHMVSEVRYGPRLLADFATASGMQVLDFSQPVDLRHAADLMEKYSDVPMDYADATLILLAERLNVSEILTLDRRGFTVFRMGRRKPLRLVLG